MSRSKRYIKNNKSSIPVKKLPPKTDLVGEALSERGLEILNRFQKNKRGVLYIYDPVSDTPSNLQNNAAIQTPHDQEDVAPNKTSSFLSELAIDNKLKDHKIESDRYIRDELSKIDGKIDKVKDRLPWFGLALILAFIGIVFALNWHFDGKLEKLITDNANWKKSIEQIIQKITPQKAYK